MRQLYFLGLLLCSSIFTFAQTSLVNSNFETGDPTVWTTANTAATNVWFVGSATANGGTKSAYITNDGGVSNVYDVNVVSTNHIYTPVSFPAGQGAIILSFDWKGIGETGGTTYDYIRVSLTSAAPVAGTVPATADQLPVLFAGAGSYTRAYVVIPASAAGTTKNLVFTWTNDSNTGDATVSPAIDNVVLTSATPAGLTGAKTIPGDYTSLGHAIANLNAHGVGAGGVTFNVTAGSNFNETALAITATGTAANQIIFQKSGGGANPTITTSALGNYGPTSTGSVTSSADAVIAIVGGDYITFDGIDVASANMNTTTNLIEYGYRVVNASATDGAKNNTIKNSSITLNRSSTSVIGILQSSSSTGAGVTATAATGSNSNNKYYNIQIQNCYTGITLTGAATTAANTDTNNEIGITGGGSTIIGASYAGTPTADIGGGSSSVSGINAVNQTSVSISNVEIRNLGGTSTVRGIYLDGAQGTSNVFRNRVYGLRSLSTSSTSGITGIEIDMASTGAHIINLYNNFITDITSAYTGAASSTRQLKGILTGSSASTSTYNVDFNSVRIDGSGSPTISSTALEFGSSTPINKVRNNILANFTEAQTGVAKHYAIRSTVATSFGASPGSVSNYNDLYIANTTNGYVGLANTTDRATISDWTTGMTGNAGTDANSINVNPDFVSPLDLHISVSSSSVNGLGTAIAGLTTDIDGQTRLSPPDIGADEYSVLAGVNIGATSLVAPISTGCYGTAETVTISIKNFATSIHDFVANPVTVTVNVTGATAYTSNLVINTGTLAAGATQNVNLPATLDMSNAGAYIFNASATATGDVEAANDAMPAASRVATANTALPQTVNFTGFTGSNLSTPFPNWREGSGATLPLGTTSTWTSQSLWGDGNVTARINLDVASDVEWLVGPKFAATANTLLKFDVAITEFADVIADATGMAGTDDKVIVKISTDCGVSFTDLFIFDASNTGSISNTLVSQTIDLSAYAGQQVIIAFYGSEGTVSDPADYDFHIDNINLYNTVPIDLGAVSLNTPLAPPTAVCYTNSETVAITVRNYGTATLNFATTPVTVTTNVTGAATATLTGTLNTGTLAPGADVVVNMSAPLNMTAAGTYTFNATASIAGDGTASNDAMVTENRINAPVVTLPQTVDFTGFTGANLTATFPNWREGSGATYPTGTTSGWTSSTVFTANGTTAKINLASNVDEEWLVGPKFTVSSLTRLKFKVAITDAASIDADPAGMVGTDDKIVVRISTDCGATYSDLYTFDASTIGTISNTLEQQSISLNAYAGQTVMVAFFASEGTVDDAASYDFHIDDINIETPFAIDAGAIALTAPATKACYSNAETVTITIKNIGGAALDFSATPVTVTTNVTGATTATLTGTVNTGTLASDATLNVTMSATLDMSALGIYTFNASTAIAGDGDAANNAMTAATKTATAVVAGTVSVAPASYCVTGGTPTLTLTGNAGGNILWQESNSATGPWANVGTNGNVYTPAAAITATMYYQAVVSCGTTTTTTNTVTVELKNPQVLTTAPGSSCGTGTVTLGATSSTGSTLNWYANSTGGTALGTGTSFVTPSISSNTTYYVGAGLGAANYSVGAATNGSTGTYTLQAGLLFSVTANMTLNGVHIYPIGTGAGTVNIALKNSAGTVLETLSFACTGTASPGIKTFVPLNWTVPVGDYWLDMTSRTGLVASLIRDATGDIVGGPIATNPAMTIPGVMTITSGRLTASGTSTSYYFFYDWQVSVGCESARVPVLASIDAPTVAGSVAGTQTICSGTSPSDLILSGQTGSVVKWQKSSDAAFTTPQDIASTAVTLTSAVIGNLTADTYFRAVVKNGACVTENSAAALVTVEAVSNAGSLNGNQSVCTGGIPADIVATGTTGNVVRWESSADAAFTSPVTIANTTTTLSPGAITSNTYYRIVVKNGVCNEAVSATPVAIMVDPTSNAGSLNGNQTICTGGTPNSIVASGVTGSVVRWESSSDAAFTTPATIANTTTTLSPGALTATTYYRVVVKSGACSEVSSTTPVMITVNSTITPSMSLAGTAGGTQLCASHDVAASANFFAGNCDIIATVTPSGAAPVSGSVNACVKVESAVPTAAGTNEPYVARHYNIIPATNAATATSTITLYFLQSEFDAFNTARGFYAALPTGTADNAGKANLRVSMFPGSATTPGTAGGTQLDPADADINFADGRWSVSFAATGSGSFFVHTGNFTLPVTLVNFRGEQSGNTNKLLWSTSTEIDNRGFELERSSDGRNFSSITFVASKAENGNSNSTLNYNYNDVRPLAGNNYYRLKQVDKDGKTTFSNVVLLSSKVADITLSSVYPNPTTRELNLVITSPKAEKVTVIVTDLTGKVLLQTATLLVIGDNQQTFNVQQLAAGTYFIKAVCANGCETAVQRFVKQ